MPRTSHTTTMDLMRPPRFPRVDLTDKKIILTENIRQVFSEKTTKGESESLAHFQKCGRFLLETQKPSVSNSEIITNINQKTSEPFSSEETDKLISIIAEHNLFSNFSDQIDDFSSRSAGSFMHSTALVGLGSYFLGAAGFLPAAVNFLKAGHDTHLDRNKLSRKIKSHLPQVIEQACTQAIATNPDLSTIAEATGIIKKEADLISSLPTDKKDIIKLHQQNIGAEETYQNSFQHKLTSIYKKIRENIASARNNEEYKKQKLEQLKFLNEAGILAAELAYTAYFDYFNKPHLANQISTTISYSVDLFSAFCQCILGIISPAGLATVLVRNIRVISKVWSQPQSNELFFQKFLIESISDIKDSLRECIAQQNRTLLLIYDIVDEIKISSQVVLTKVSHLEQHITDYYDVVNRELYHNKFQQRISAIDLLSQIEQPSQLPYQLSADQALNKLFNYATSVSYATVFTSNNLTGFSQISRLSETLDHAVSNRDYKGRLDYVIGFAPKLLTYLTNLPDFAELIKTEENQQEKINYVERLDILQSNIANPIEWQRAAYAYSMTLFYLRISPNQTHLNQLIKIKNIGLEMIEALKNYSRKEILDILQIMYEKFIPSIVERMKESIKKVLDFAADKFVVYLNDELPNFKIEKEVFYTGFKQKIKLIEHFEHIIAGKKDWLTLIRAKLKDSEKGQFYFVDKIYTIENDSFKRNHISLFTVENASVDTNFLSLATKLGVINITEIPLQPQYSDPSPILDGKVQEEIKKYSLTFNVGPLKGKNDVLFYTRKIGDIQFYDFENKNSTCRKVSQEQFNVIKHLLGEPKQVSYCKGHIYGLSFLDLIHLSVNSYLCQIRDQMYNINTLKATIQGVFDFTPFKITAFSILLFSHFVQVVHQQNFSISSLYLDSIDQLYNLNALTLGSKAIMSDNFFRYTFITDTGTYEPLVVGVNDSCEDVIKRLLDKVSCLDIDLNHGLSDLIDRVESIRKINPEAGILSFIEDTVLLLDGLITIFQTDLAHLQAQRAVSSSLQGDSEPSLQVSTQPLAMDLRPSTPISTDDIQTLLGQMMHMCRVQEDMRDQLVLIAALQQQVKSQADIISELREQQARTNSEIVCLQNGQRENYEDITEIKSKSDACQALIESQQGWLKQGDKKIEDLAHKVTSLSALSTTSHSAKTERQVDKLKPYSLLPVDQQDKYKELIQACEQADFDKVRVLIEKDGLNPIYADENDRYPIGVAIWYLSPKLMKYFINLLDLSQNDWYVVANSNMESYSSVVAVLGNYYLRSSSGRSPYTPVKEESLHFDLYQYASKYEKQQPFSSLLSYESLKKRGLSTIKLNDLNICSGDQIKFSWENERSGNPDNTHKWSENATETFISSV